MALRQPQKCAALNRALQDVQRRASDVKAEISALTVQWEILTGQRTNERDLNRRRELNVEQTGVVQRRERFRRELETLFKRRGDIENDRFFSGC